MRETLVVKELTPTASEHLHPQKTYCLFIREKAILEPFVVNFTLRIKSRNAIKYDRRVLP